MDINTVIVEGRLASDPELREFESGARLVRYLLTIRTDEPHRRIDVVPVTLWNPGANGTAYVRGERLRIIGTVQRRFWTSNDGRRSRLEIVASHVEPASHRDVSSGAAV